jgi:hypothetical protein
MSYAVELLFDPEAEVRVRALWAALADAGFERRKGYANPHVSLSVFDTSDLGSLLPHLEQRAQRAAGLELRMAQLGLFVDGDTPLAFLGVTPSRQLLRLHRDIASTLDDLAEATRPYYRSDGWLPHCTLPVQLARLDSRLAVACKGALPIEARVEHVLVIDIDTGEAVAKLF